MACLFKQTTYRKDPKTGEMVRVKSKKWWGRYRDSLERDRRVPLSTNKRAAQALLDQILDDVELARAGLVNPVREAEKKTIQEHLQDFEYHLKGKKQPSKVYRRDGPQDQSLHPAVRMAEGQPDHGARRRTVPGRASRTGRPEHSHE